MNPLHEFDDEHYQNFLRAYAEMMIDEMTIAEIMETLRHCTLNYLRDTTKDDVWDEFKNSYDEHSDDLAQICASADLLASFDGPFNPIEHLRKSFEA